MNDDSLDDNKLITERKEKLAELRKKGNPYPNDIKPSISAAALLDLYGNQANTELEELDKTFKICGRLMAKRVMGKLSFLRIDDGSGIIQLCLQKDRVGEEAYSFMKSLDVGDILTSEGALFRTKTNELSIRSINLGLIS